MSAFVLPNALSTFYGSSSDTLGDLVSLERVVPDPEFEAATALQRLLGIISPENEPRPIKKQKLAPPRLVDEANVLFNLSKMHTADPKIIEQQMASLLQAFNTIPPVFISKPTKPIEDDDAKTSRYSAFRKASNCPYCKDIGENCGKVAAKCPNRPCNNCNRRHRLNRCRKIGCKHCPGDHLSSKCPVKIKQWTQASAARRRDQRLSEKKNAGEN